MQVHGHEHARTAYEQDFNPKFHAHDFYFHAHEVMPLLYAHKLLLRDQKHEHSLFMGISYKRLHAHGMNFA